MISVASIFPVRISGKARKVASTKTTWAFKLGSSSQIDLFLLPFFPYRVDIHQGWIDHRI